MKKTVEDLDSLRYFEEFERISAQYNTEEFKKLVEKEAREEEVAQATKEGREEGKKEGIIETAKNLLKMDMKIEDIEKATNLTKEEIENIK